MAGLSALTLVDAGEGAGQVGARLVMLALVALVAALVLGWSVLLPASLLLVGAAYALHLYLDEGFDVKAPLFAAGLLLAAELGYWSLEEREQVRSEPGEGLRRLAFVAGLTLAGLVVGTVLLAAADLARAGGLAVDLVGAGAAAAALLLVVLYARRQSG